MASDDSDFCHLCGSRENLSFEHIPPRRCYNDKSTRVVEMVYKELPDKRRLTLALARKYHDGMGRRSLCAKCNSVSGDHYGAGFFEWANQAWNYAEKVGEENHDDLIFNIKPLHVLKQLATMAIAAADPSAAPFHRYLRRFIREPFARFRPPELAFHVYLNPPDPNRRAFMKAGDRLAIPLTRMTKTCMVLDTITGNTLMLFAEIAFPPLGYVVRFRNDDWPLPEQVRDMPDISFFGQYGYDQTAMVALKLPVRIPVGPTPGHYMNVSKES